MQGGVRKRGSKWYYYFDVGKIDGSRNRIERPAEGATSKTEARAILRRKIAEYEETGAVFKPSEMTVHDFFNFWMREYVELKLKLNTQYNYERCLRLHILPVIGKQKLRTLSPEQLQIFINGLVRQGLARQTISIIRGILSKALKHAVYPYKMIRESPMQYVELIMRDDQAKPTREDLKIQSRENLRRLSQYYSEGHDFYVSFQIGLYTGLRVAEMCGLEWSAVDLDARTITVKQQMIGKTVEGADGKNHTEWDIGPPKSKSGYREISIGDTLVSILRKEQTKQKRDRLRYGEFYQASALGDFVCRKESGDPITPSVAKYNTRIAGQDLCIDFNYHSLRHTHATLLIEQGLPIKTVQRRLGHSRSSITEDRYVHLTQKMSRDAADIFDNITGNL